MDCSRLVRTMCRKACIVVIDLQRAQSHSRIGPCKWVLGGFSGCGKAFTPLDQIQLPGSPVELGPKRQTDKGRWSDPPKRMMGRPVTIFGRKIYLLQPTIIQAVLQAFSASGTRLTQSFLAIYFRDNSIVMDGFALPVEYDPLWRGEIIAHCV